MIVENCIPEYHLIVERKYSLGKSFDIFFIIFERKFRGFFVFSFIFNSFFLFGIEKDKIAWVLEDLRSQNKTKKGTNQTLANKSLK